MVGIGRLSNCSLLLGPSRPCRPCSDSNMSILISVWMLINLEFSKQICMQNRVVFQCVVPSLWQALESWKQNTQGKNSETTTGFFLDRKSLTGSQPIGSEATHLGCGGACRTPGEGGVGLFLHQFHSLAHTLPPRTRGYLGYSFCSCFQE